jgi:hypothetical protein
MKKKGLVESVIDRRYRKAIGNAGRQAYAFGPGLLSSVEGLGGIDDVAVWTVVTKTTLYRLNGTFWMCEESTLGVPAKKVFHFLAEVSEDQATEFLGKHSYFVEMDGVKNRIVELDRKQGVMSNE